MDSTTQIEQNNVALAVSLTTALIAADKCEPGATISETLKAVYRTVATLPGSHIEAVPVEPEAETFPQPSAREVKKSITPDAIISFIDGKPYQTLKRHLSKHGLDEKGYRERYGLSKDYPMVAATYSEKRRQLAQAIGLGSKTRAAAKPAAKGKAKKAA